VVTRDVVIILKVCKITGYLLKCTGVDGESVNPVCLLLRLVDPFRTAQLQLYIPSLFRQSNDGSTLYAI